MRFAILLVGGLATGALSVGAVRTMVPPNAQMFQAVRALGGDMANFKLADINPLKAYEDVKRQITSGNLGGSIGLGSATPVSHSPRSATSGSATSTISTIGDAEGGRGWDQQPCSAGHPPCAGSLGLRPKPDGLARRAAALAAPARRQFDLHEALASLDAIGQIPCEQGSMVLAPLSLRHHGVIDKSAARRRHGDQLLLMVCGTFPEFVRSAFRASNVAPRHHVRLGRPPLPRR